MVSGRNRPVPDRFLEAIINNRMKTLELRNYGVRELEPLECKPIDGGFLLPALATVYLGVMITSIMSDPKGVLNGFLDAFN